MAEGEPKKLLPPGDRTEPEIGEAGQCGQHTVSGLARHRERNPEHDEGEQPGQGDEVGRKPEYRPGDGQS